MAVMSNEMRDFYDGESMGYALLGVFKDPVWGIAEPVKAPYHPPDLVLKPLTDDQIQDINDHVTRLLQKAKRRRRERNTTNILLETLRKMAWAKAKAELEGILETYWSMDREFQEIETEIWSFIERMEDRL